MFSQSTLMVLLIFASHKAFADYLQDTRSQTRNNEAYIHVPLLNLADNHHPLLYPPMHAPYLTTSPITCPIIFLPNQSFSLCSSHRPSPPRSHSHNHRYNKRLRHTRHLPSHLFLHFFRPPLHHLLPRHCLSLQRQIPSLRNIHLAIRSHHTISIAQILHYQLHRNQTTPRKPRCKIVTHDQCVVTAPVTCGFLVAAHRKSDVMFFLWLYPSPPACVSLPMGPW
jgi:hypothetical protein